MIVLEAQMWEENRGVSEYLQNEPQSIATTKNKSNGKVIQDALRRPNLWITVYYSFRLKHSLADLSQNTDSCL